LSGEFGDVVLRCSVAVEVKGTLHLSRGDEAMPVYEGNDGQRIACWQPGSGKHA
jgi:hypothetical protein